jgi:hypothetical protein
MKTVFNSDMCAHVWAQRTQDYGCNSSRSMSFQGGVAYSYRTPVANIVTGANGQSVVLFTSNSYSMTTSSKHMPAYRRAAGHFGAFSVPFVLASDMRGDREREHAANMRYLESLYTKERDGLMRCPADSYRLRDNSRDYGDDTAAGPARPYGVLYALYAERCRYAAAFGLEVPAHDWQADAAAIIARRDRILNDPKRAHKQALAAAARERAEARKAEKAAEARRIAGLESAERVRLWLAGADVRLHYSDVDRAVGHLVRIRGDKVETTGGAECPLSHAVPALAFWRRTVDAGITFQRAADAAVPVRLGHFNLDRIESDGTVRAGCHTFRRPELERLESLIAGTTGVPVA